MAIKFTSILKDIIVESSRFQVLFDKYVKPKERGQKGMMPLQVLFKIIAGDPTSKIPDGMTIENVTAEKMENIKIGKYTQWLLKNFVSPKIELQSGVTDPNSPQVKQAVKEWQDLFLEDLYKTTQDLMKFERNKNKLPQEYRDINKLTPETLYNQVKDFSLEKTKATAQEKKEAANTYEFPGAKVVFRGSDWTVVKIEGTDEIHQKAACFYGGHHLEPSKGETRWCTSSPGLSYWKSYLSRGPLYVVIPNTPRRFKGFDKEVGEKSGLPADRYQFHFQDRQFMDAEDRQIDLIDFLNTNETGLKEFFKPEFMKNLTQGIDGTKVSVNFPGDPASKFISLYGSDEFFNELPKSITRLEFIAKNSKLDLNIPATIGDLTNLTAIHLVGCVASLPSSICNLQKLQFLSLPDNPNLQELPECIADLPKLSIINLKGSRKDALPPSLQNMGDDSDLHIFL